MTSEVNLDRVRLLVADLRTPGIAQGHGYLTQAITDPVTQETVDHDCCLGRACKVALANGVKGLDVARSEHTAAVDYLYRGTRADDPDDPRPAMFHEGAVLPPPVRDWFGFRVVSPQLKTPNGDTQDAVVLNDELRWTFGQIATAFEVTFLGGTYPEDAMTWPGMPDYRTIVAVMDEPFGLLEP